jgi:hypothetical protein
MYNNFQKHKILNWHQNEIDFCEYSCRLIGNDYRKRLNACQPSIGLFWNGIASLRHLIEEMSRSAPKFAPNY